MISYSIDYYSFTIPTEYQWGKAMFDGDNSYAIEETLRYIGLSSQLGIQSTDWAIETGGKHYATRLRHTTGLAVSYGSANKHIFVELSGKACNTFDANNWFERLVLQTHNRCSRIDFACDIETKVSPVEFSALRNSKQFKSSGHKDSPSGSTYYVGGRTGERMARVYRYEPPHPRHNLLRVEAEYKGKAAKASAKHFTEVSCERACLDAHSPFQWTHPAWTSENTSGVKIAYKNYNPQNASTIRWLYGDVITALSKAVRADLVELEDWLKSLHKAI